LTAYLELMAAQQAAASAVEVAARKRAKPASTAADADPQADGHMSRPFECDQCDHTFAKSSNLRRHQLSHTGEKPFACDQCDYRGVTNSHLSLHQRVHSTEDSKPYVCEHCDYRSHSISHLQVHEVRFSRWSILFGLCHSGHSVSLSSWFSLRPPITTHPPPPSSFSAHAHWGEAL
jgi:hypothetical protein